MISLRIDGIEELMAKLQAVSPQRLGPQTRRALLAGAHVCEAYAKIYCPVDTGFLRSSITTEALDDYDAIVAPHAEYAAYVEYGTYKMDAQPYMRPALYDHIGEIAEVVRRYLSEAIQGAFS